MTAKILSGALADIQCKVDAFFDAHIPRDDGPAGQLCAAMRYAAIGGGKRLRPLLTAASAQLFAGDAELALRAGCAVEAIHIYSLIHDDLPCMDDDDQRHGKPSLHKAYDEATAVLAGDALQALAFDIVSRPSLDPAISVQMTRCLAQASGASGMVGGQMMDMAAEKMGAEPFDLPLITRLQEMKTGALLGAAIEMGVVAARASADDRMRLLGYARDIGLAFQISDDILDVEGDAVKMGKAVRKDAALGKATFVTHLGIDGARMRARALTDAAISKLDIYGERAELLREIARFIVERDR